MSYLPRMSKTYKEPEERPCEEPAKEITLNSIPIASAMPDDKVCSPQSVLKQYSFYPHPPPQLPGPSLIAEAEHNERVNEVSKRRRTKEDIYTTITPEQSTNDFPYNKSSRVINIALTSGVITETENNVEIIPSSRKSSKPNKLPSLRFLPSLVKNVEECNKDAKTFPSIMDNAENLIVPEPSVNSDSVETVVKPGAIKPSESNIKSNLKSDLQNTETPSPVNFLNHLPSFLDEGVQCTLNGTIEKITVLPLSVHYLIRTLSFLVQELDKNESEECFTQAKEVKKLLNQVNETVTVLLNKNYDNRYEFQTWTSDSKRLEKIYNDLQEYIKHIYGENGKLGCKSDEKKKIYCKLFQKDCELKVLNEKLRESDIQNPSLKIINQPAKAPEVMLQNKDLENEQLAAEIEFTSQELKRFQEALAEKNWEIEKSKEEIEELKKKLTTIKLESKRTFI